MKIVHDTASMWAGRPTANATEADRTNWEMMTNDTALALASAIGVDLHNCQPPPGYSQNQPTVTAGSGAAAGTTPVRGG